MKSRFSILAFTFLIQSSMALASDFSPQFYGFIKASVVGSDGALDSNGFNNMSAPNSAANPVLATQPNWGRSSFQYTQSRFGLKMGQVEDTQALLEFDFMDFQKSTPTTQSLIRVRRALISHHLDESWRIQGGLDLDLVSPLHPTSFNYVGHYFLSGDLGFMRLQLQAFKKAGNFEHAVALGFPSPNAKNPENGTELSGVPTLALREAVTEGVFYYGISAMVGEVRLNSKLPQKIIPYLANLFFKWSDDTNELNTEAYYGKSLANLNLQSLSYSNSTHQNEEAGAFATLKHKLDANHAIFGGAGISKILGQKDIPLGYAAPAIAGPTPAGTLFSGAQGPGIRENSTLRLGYEFKPKSTLSYVAELGEFFTTHQLTPADAALWSSHRHATYLEVGMKLDF